VPQQPAPDPREPCTGSHDDWLACVTAMATPQASAVQASAVPVFAKRRRRAGDLKSVDRFSSFSELEA